MLSFLNVQKLIKGYVSSARSTVELIPWACLWDESTVMTVDQGLVAAFEFDGIDPEGRPQYEIDHAVNAFERAFSGFGSGTVSWTVVERRKSNDYPSGHEAQGLSAYVEDQWKQQTVPSQYVNKYSMAIYQRTSDGASRFLDEMDRVVKENNKGFLAAFLAAAKSRLSVRENIRLNTRLVRAAKEQLDARISELQNGMARLGLRQLKGSDLLAYLFNRVNPVSGTRKKFPLPSHLAQFLGFSLSSDEIKRTPSCLVFSDGAKKRYVGVISLKGWPNAATSPGRLDYLLAVNGEVTLSHCFRHIDASVAANAIDSVERYNVQSSVPFIHRMYTTLTKEEPSKFDAGRLALAEDARGAKEELVASQRMFGYHNLTILCYGDTEEEMEEVRAQVMRRLSDSSFTGRVERMHQLAAFCQTLPGQWAASVRWSNVSFGNAADIAPIRTLLSGPMHCEHFTKELKAGSQPVLISVPTDSGVPFNWDPFESGAGHTAFIGPTRNGKTALVNMLLTMFKKYPGARTIRIDKDYSCKIATELGGGTHVDLRSDDGPGARMCPIALVHDARHHIFVIGWVRRLIESLADRRLSPDEIDKVTQAVRNLKSLPAETHTLASIRAGIGVLGRYLDDWISEGSMAGWFDNPPSTFEMGDDMCFEMKRLFDDELVSEMAMDYLFYLIEDSLDGRPLIVNVEETWFFLRNKRFVERLEDFLRTIGKRNGALWITTQSARELTEDPKLAALVEQLKNRVYLPNPGILTARSGYDLMGLTEDQLVRIAAGEPKRDYYIQTPSMVRMATIRIPETVIPVISASARALNTFERCKQSGSPIWDEQYMNEMLEVA